MTTKIMMITTNTSHHHSISICETAPDKSIHGHYFLAVINKTVPARSGQCTSLIDPLKRVGWGKLNSGPPDRRIPCNDYNGPPVERLTHQLYCRGLHIIVLFYRIVSCCRWRGVVSLGRRSARPETAAAAAASEIILR